MNMTPELSRRTFFFLGFSFAIAKTLGMYVPSDEKLIYKPTQRQIDFVNSKDDFTLYGIPYHENNASTGSWLGISRVT